ncbi:conserved hypothetical protein [Flavobacterium sp. 9AF]|uniref:hypothetical protein n=1 Tax=Flavobacterium sp. 9AF TaxID=2653142 RepID=UPI0012F1FD87|nr:hypothetical protein [Flavobacterium sp. 9AF]VXC25674.1 conserved hypothetical protein [Flavobacterium sp. 9AF]
MDIEKLIKDLKEALLSLLGEKYKEFKPEVQKDITHFLKESEEKLKRWILLLAEGSITKEELEWLLKSQKDIIALKALQTAGISKIRLNNIKNTIIKTIFDIVVTTVIK